MASPYARDVVTRDLRCSAYVSAEPGGSFHLVWREGVEPPRMNRSRGYSPGPFLLGVLH